MSVTPLVHRLANGARLVVLPMPHLRTASVSAYLHVGSAHESKRLNGIGHVVEHMVFKGTATRDARKVNLDAEMLGAEVNAHTDKDHTAFHLRGLAVHAEAFLHQLGDLIGAPAFPDDELERERQVLLQEYAEVEDDPLDAVFQGFDRACWGTHAGAQPIIGTRRNIERFSAAELQAHARTHFTGANLVVGVAGGVDPDAMRRAAEIAFGGLPAGEASPLPAATYVGGLRSRPMAGSSQTHLVLGGALPPMAADDPTGALAAAVLGEGMASPLLECLREQRGIVYHGSCSADVLEHGGQFVIEASLAPERLEECLQETLRLLHEQATAVSAQDLERARHQLAVRRLRQHERSWRVMEQVALDVLLLGRVRDDADWLARLEATPASAVQAVFEGLLARKLSVSLSGKVPRGTSIRLRGMEGVAA